MIDPTLKNSLLGAVQLTKSFSFPGGGFGSNVIIFGVEDMSSSVHGDNRKKTF